MGSSFIHLIRTDSNESLQAINAGEGVEKREPSYTVGGNADWYSHYGKQCGDFLKNAGGFFSLCSLNVSLHFITDMFSEEKSDIVFSFFL